MTDERGAARSSRGNRRGSRRDTVVAREAITGNRRRASCGAVVARESIGDERGRRRRRVGDRR
jgi:hypothetical protein